jgi:trk system potassium uptake protein TrkA
MNPGKYAIIGLGQFGKAIAKALAKRGAEVLGIDTDPKEVNNISDDVAFAVVLDGSDKKALLANDIMDFDAVIVTIGQDFEQLLMCTVVLMELKVNRIIVRSSGKNSRIILEKMGVREILSPEDEVGVIVAERLTHPNLMSYLQLPDDYRVAEIKTPPNIVGRTVEEVNIRDNYNLSLIALKEGEEISSKVGILQDYHIKGVPVSSTVIEENDFLIVFGMDKDIQRFIEINQ